MEKEMIMETLRQQLDQAQQEAMKAAGYGKMLMDENQELSDRIEELRRSTDKRIEHVEQEKYDLQTKLDNKQSMEAWYNEEVSHLKQQLEYGQSSLRDTLEAEKNQEVARLMRQIEELRTDLEMSNSLEQQLRQEKVELEELLEERACQREASQSCSFTANEELLLLQDDLQREVTSLKSQLIDKRTELQSRESEIEALRSKLGARDEEMEEVKCHIVSLSNNVEEARMEKLDLQCQLDALRMETSGHRKKGNSIFSELDDRRLEAEKKLISLQVMNDTLKEKYQVEKQQNQKYKRQISQLLLQLSTGRVDGEYVANLESKLVQARDEVRTLVEEKSNLQDKKQCEVKVMSELDSTKVKDGDYVQYLITLIEGKEQELVKLQQEVSHKTIQLLDEKSRSSGQECKMKQVEADKDRLRSQNMKLLLRLEELQLKYEPDSIKKSGALVVKCTEKIPTDKPEEVKIRETSRYSMNTSRLPDNSTICQPKYSAKLEQTLPKPLIENLENVPINPPLSKFIKTKTVSISDNVEEREIERVASDTENKEVERKERSKGRRVTNIKHVSSADTSKTMTVKDVNECKSQ